MIGLATPETNPYRPHCNGTSARKSERRRFILRRWSAEKYDLPVFDYSNGKPIKVAAARCIAIINARGDCHYAARDWFESVPIDTDAWASAAWKFLGKRKTGGERR